MDYKEQIDRLRSEISELENSELAVELFDDLITYLLARAEAAEVRCETLEKMVKEYQEVIIPGYREQAEKAEREQDAAVSDLTFAVNQYRLFTTDIDLCGLCKFDLPPAGENGQTHECPGFYKDNCFEWRGQKEK